MSDSLRDRIAAVLDAMPADHRPTSLVNLDRADAVIAALGLSEEFMIRQFPDGVRRKDFRYVTSWNQRQIDG